MTRICVKPDSSTSKMKKRTEKFGTQVLYFDIPAAQREVFKRSTTYLAKIALVLQDAPGKMLIFTQLMDKLAPLISKNRRSVKNSIRVCLSAHRCFVKIPVIPDSRDSKRNYWKLDCSQITSKMVRRHFTRLLKIFPELASKLEADSLNTPSEEISALPSPKPAACSSVQVRCEVKFTGPFSIESLLKRDSPSAQVSRGSPLSSVQMWADQQQQPRPKHTRMISNFYSENDPFLQTSSGCSPICSAGGSTHHGDVESTRWIPVHTEPSSSIYTRAGAPSYFTSSTYSYITCSVPTFTPETLRF